LSDLIMGYFLVQLKTLAANEGAKIPPFGDGDLERLVLRPAIERWPAEKLDLVMQNTALKAAVRSENGDGLADYRRHHIGAACMHERTNSVIHASEEIKRG